MGEMGNRDPGLEKEAILIRINQGRVLLREASLRRVEGMLTVICIHNHRFVIACRFSEARLFPSANQFIYFFLEFSGDGVCWLRIICLH